MCALTSPGTIAAPGNSILGKPAGAARRTSAFGPASRTVPSATATAPGENVIPASATSREAVYTTPCGRSGADFMYAPSCPPDHKTGTFTKLPGSFVNVPVLWSVPAQTAAATRGRWLSDSTFRFTLVIRFFRST